MLTLTQKVKYQLEDMDDKEIVEVWKIYISKAKNFPKNSKEFKINSDIADYAMKLHKENIK